MIEAIIGTAIILVFMGLGPTRAQHERSKRHQHDRDPY